MDRMLLLLKGSTEQEVALDELLRQQQDATSSQYHRWLTPAEFGDRFGASPEDTAAIMDWLKSHGFSVSGATNGRRQIEFGGTARQVEQTFQTEIHNYDLRGESYTANATDIAIPTAIAPVVAGIVALHNFPVKTRPPVKAAANFTDGSHGVSPYDFATLYNVLPLWNSQGVDGTGQSIAVVAQSNINVGDISAFRTQFGLPANNPQVILTGADPGLVKGDQDEATLDSE
jgi:subtilase family serine protease